MGRRRNRSHKPRQHASSSQPHDRRHRDQDETSNAGEDSLLIDQNNDDNSGVAANGTKNPNQHGVNEALIARWTRRLGIYTLVLAVATVALVIATGIGAYFLYETDRSIKDQLQEMRAQTATTKAQVRANISPDPFGVDQVIENGQITAWQITPRWRNNGPTDALDYSDWWNWAYVDGKYSDFNSLKCPSISEPANVHHLILQAGHPIAQLAQRVPAVWIPKAVAKEGAIIISGHIEYRDIFPGDPLHYINWCDLFMPNDPANNRFSFISLEQDSR